MYIIRGVVEGVKLDEVARNKSRTLAQGAAGEPIPSPASTGNSAQGWEEKGGSKLELERLVRTLSLAVAASLAR